MKVTKSLPSPSEDALQHSLLLQQKIAEAIEINGGRISFRRYMEMALYEPGLGYYVAGKRKIGAQGDFTTAPEVSPLFSQCIANQCAQVLNAVGGGDILELGAGTGTMAADILLHLEQLECLPVHYYILDLSPELKALQHQTLTQKSPHLLNRVSWLNQLPEVAIKGVIVGNEVLDAMPVELFQLKQGEIAQLNVGIQDNTITLFPTSATDSIKTHVERLDIQESEHYLSEYNPNIDPWMKTISNSLEQGLVLLIDYGYSRSEYYHPDRSEGTLICHYQHLVHTDYFWQPGLQDITANVDFTHVAEASDNSGLYVAGFTSQAAFLANCGLEELFIQALTAKPEQQYQLAQQIRTLSLPAEMGERFKVIALSKDVDHALIGFSAFNLKHKL